MHTTGRFTEVADRVWVAHYDWLHVNITLVGGSDGLVMVDTHGSTRQARMVADDAARLGVGAVTALVNTHDHWDHWFGNDALVTAYGDVPIHATQFALDKMVERGGRHDAHLADEPHAEEILATELRPATHGFSSAHPLVLGDRLVELIHPGRGHTAGDLVVRVPDADVVVMGDLVEESDKPWIGDDSYPLEWPATLDLALQMITPATVVVPGHGELVDREFVHDQRSELGIIAETIRDLAGRGVPATSALEEGDWPWDPSLLATAVQRGFEQLPRSQKRLPLA
ncbi:MBL fold metallo-hydrolase [Nocardioides piscis]|uniref:MBL fold metallo-hydrolase n=1 Tax=Nocardioides piscis TaxID=2714938 RepID=A0A6G7YGR6_9ACTN|nr:MBL fold metallo-hydrolase [Nocardioides piscis]QIK75993.1 MBL fold metallo-hydrolase [Nocardioides piscis]